MKIEIKIKLYIRFQRIFLQFSFQIFLVIIIFIMAVVVVVSSDDV